MKTRVLARISLGLALALVAVLVWHVSKRTLAIDREHYHYFDHMRHLLVTWVFLHEGLRIYAVPWGALSPPEDWHWGWDTIPYVYPPGALGLFLPGAIAARRLALVDVAHFYVLVFSAASVFGARRLWLAGVEVFLNPAYRVLWSAFVLAFLMHALGWSLNGEYDAVVVLVVLWAAVARAPANRIVLLGMAIFLKFQAFLYLPFFARELFAVVDYESPRKTKLARAALGVALVGASAAVAGYLALHGTLVIKGGTPLHIAEWRSDRATLVTLLTTAAFVLAACWQTQFEAALTIAWTFAAYASLAMVQGWYVVYLFPLAILVRQPARLWVATWVFSFLYLLRWIPDVYRFIDDVLMYPI